MSNESISHDSGSQSVPEPTVVPVHAGDDLKVLQGSGDSRVFMPEHYCTHEAQISMLEGIVSIRLTDSDDEVVLEAGSAYVITPKQRHTLSSEGPFRLFLTMPAQAELLFPEATRDSK